MRRAAEQKKEKEGGLPLKIAVIAASVTAVLAVPSCIAAVAALLQSPNPAPIYSGINVHAYPRKLVYIAGEDNSLDLAGGVVCYSRGKQKAEDGICTEKKCSEVQDVNQGIDNGFILNTN